MSVRYSSTRGAQVGLTFEEVVLAGLATDKGLYVPDFIPTFTSEELEEVCIN
jgi:threonine synthase